MTPHQRAGLIATLTQAARLLEAMAPPGKSDARHSARKLREQVALLRDPEQSTQVFRRETR